MPTAKTMTNYSANTFSNPLSLDGVDDYISLPATATDSGEITVEAWLYSEDVNRNWVRIIDFGNGAGSDNLLLAFSFLIILLKLQN